MGWGGFDLDTYVSEEEHRRLRYAGAHALQLGRPVDRSSGKSFHSLLTLAEDLSSGKGELKITCSNMTPKNLRKFRFNRGDVELEHAKHSGFVGSASWFISGCSDSRGEGTLVIEPPKGETYGMMDWGEEPPWRQYALDIKNVIVRLGVKAQTLSGAFEGCENLVAADLTALDVSEARDMRGAFSACSALEFVKTEGWKTSSIENVSCAFENCSSLREIDLSSWEVRSLVDATRLFYGCSVLSVAILSKWDVPITSRLESLFENCGKLDFVSRDGWSLRQASKICDSIPHSARCVVYHGGTVRLSSALYDVG